MIFDQTAKVRRAVPSAPGRACSALATNIRKSVIFAQIFCATAEERRAGTARPTFFGSGSAGLGTGAPYLPLSLRQYAKGHFAISKPTQSHSARARAGGTANKSLRVGRAK